jgi:hypothetical protein
LRRDLKDRLQEVHMFPKDSDRPGKIPPSPAKNTCSHQNLHTKTLLPLATKNEIISAGCICFLNFYGAWNFYYVYKKPE